ncbi:hypothetical protein [Streptomyces sp. NPDC059894]
MLVRVARHSSEGTWNQQLGSQLPTATAALFGMTVRTRRDHTEA